MLTLKALQDEVDAWISQFETGYFPPLLQLARLTEELGELARVLSHREGKTPKPGEAMGELEEEIGDLLFVLASLANSQGVDLEAAFKKTMAKVRQRDRDRWKRRQG